jgi:glycosyltransferase involved in cell wall biosynthesis
MMVIAALLVLPSVIVAFLAAYNMAAWPSGRAAASKGRVRWRWSVLVPARNEARSIGALLESVLTEDVEEIIVCDDNSSDETSAIVASYAARDPRVHLLRGAPLPHGWVGKPHACHQLAQCARGERWLFLDADVRLERDALPRLEALLDMEGLEAGLLSAMPRQETGTWLERWIVPLLHLTYLAWLPIPLIWRNADPRLAMANGQLMALDPTRLPARIATFEAVREELVDDVALVRAAKQAGVRVLFVDGAALASCRMYRSAGEVWRGFSKNLYEGLGASAALLGWVVVVHLGVFVAPFVVSALALAAIPSLVTIPAEVALAAHIGVVVNVLLRVTLAIRFGHSWAGVLAHPLAILVLVAIALNSLRWWRMGRIAWAGRTYAPRGRGGTRGPTEELSLASSTSTVPSRRAS